MAEQWSGPDVHDLDTHFIVEPIGKLCWTVGALPIGTGATQLIPGLNCRVSGESGLEIKIPEVNATEVGQALVPTPVCGDGLLASRVHMPVETVHVQWLGQ